MLRDMFMAALGAASGLGFVVIAVLLVKARERAERSREFTGGEHGDFTATMRQRHDVMRDEYVEHGGFD
jgi:hypothetical protein